MKLYQVAYLFNSDKTCFAPGALVVEEGQVVDIGELDFIKKQYPSAEILDYSQYTLLPGLVDAHSDLSLSLKDFSPKDFQQKHHGDFRWMPWVVEVSRYKAQLDTHQQRQAVAQGLEEVRSQGITTLGEVCRYPVVFPQYESSGLRVAVLAEVENIQRPQAQEDFEQALAMAEEIEEKANPRLSPGLAPFSAYSLSKHLLRLLADHAFHQNWPLHLQVAMSFAELEFFYDSMGEIPAVLFKEAGWQDKIPPPHRMTPVGFLKEIGFFKSSPSLVGCLHLGPSDEEIIKANSCIRILSPQAFKKLHLGEVDWKKLFEEQVPWAWASLGRAWGGSVNPWKEMLTVLEIFDSSQQEEAAWWILQAFTQNGARALGLKEKAGCLKKGVWADFVLVASQGSSSLPALIKEPPKVEACFVAGQRLV